jgi:hypothetical protein
MSKFLITKKDRTTVGIGNGGVLYETIEAAETYIASQKMSKVGNEYHGRNMASKLFPNAEVQAWVIEEVEA